jgi:excisionase family DNA binding protein
VSDVAEKMLTVVEAAARLNTSPRFPRRLIAERRIAFVRVGRHVRIPESALEELLQAGRVEPLAIRWRAGRAVAQ